MAPSTLARAGSVPAPPAAVPTLGRAALPLLLLLLTLTLAHGLCAWPAEQPDWEHPLLGPDFATRHWLGTDAIGRDVLALTLAAARGSLLVACGAALLGVLGGGLLGGLAGWRGGLSDWLLTRTLVVLQSLPLLLLAVLVLSLFDTGFVALLGLLAVYAALDVARLARSRVLALRGQAFSAAARLQGAGAWRAFRVQILPNLQPLLPAALLLAVPQAVLVESFLGFLGLGPADAAQSLGSLLAEGMQDLQGTPMLLLAPATVMVWLLLGLSSLTRRWSTAESP